MAEIEKKREAARNVPEPFVQNLAADRDLSELVYREKK
jgi:hypothetical protein